MTFCIPTGELEDADATSHRLAAKTHVPEPVQGWEQGVRDIADIVSVCESEQAIGTVQERNRELLKALSRERPELYSQLGELHCTQAGLAFSLEGAAARCEDGEAKASFDQRSGAGP